MKQNIIINNNQYLQNGETIYPLSTDAIQFTLSTQGGQIYIDVVVDDEPISYILDKMPTEKQYHNFISAATKQILSGDLDSDKIESLLEKKILKYTNK